MNEMEAKSETLAFLQIQILSDRNFDLATILQEYKRKNSFESLQGKISWLNFKTDDYDIHTTIVNRTKEGIIDDENFTGSLFRPNFANLVILQVDTSNITAMFDYYETIFVKRGLEIAKHLQKDVAIIGVITGCDSEFEYSSILHKLETEYYCNEFIILDKNNKIGDNSFGEFADLKTLLINQVKTKMSKLVTEYPMLLQDRRADHRDHCVNLWKKIVNKDTNWVVFDQGTWLYIDEKYKDKTSRALEIMIEYGPVMAGGPAGDFNIGHTGIPDLWLVSGHHEDMLNFVTIDEFPIKEHASLRKKAGIAVGYKGRTKRHMDGIMLDIIHIA